MLTNRELATVLAALRYWQEDCQCNPDHRRDEIDDIATNGGELAALDDAEVDALCERLGAPEQAPMTDGRQPWRVDQNEDTGAVFLKRYGGQIVAEFDRTPTTLADAADIVAKLNKAEAPAGDEALALSLLRGLVATFGPAMDRDEEVNGADAVDWLARFVPRASKALQVNPLDPLTIAYVGIGAFRALGELTDDQHSRIMGRHEGQLCIVDAALTAARAANIDATPCDGCHAYEVSEEFGAAFVAAEVAELSGGAA